MQNPLVEHSFAIVATVALVGAALAYRSGIAKVFGIALLVEAGLFALLVMAADLPDGGTLTHPPDLVTRLPTTTWMIWTLVVLMAAVVPAVVAVHIRASRSRAAWESLVRVDRTVATVLTYVFTAGLFWMAGAVIGGVSGLGHAGPGGGPDQQYTDSSAKAGGMMGAMVGLFVAHRARKYEQAKKTKRSGGGRYGRA